MKENKMNSLCKSDVDDASYHSYNYSLPQAYLQMHIFRKEEVKFTHKLFIKKFVVPMRERGV